MMKHNDQIVSSASLPANLQRKSMGIYAPDLLQQSLLEHIFIIFCLTLSLTKQLSQPLWQPLWIASNIFYSQSQFWKLVALSNTLLIPCGFLSLVFSASSRSALWYRQVSSRSRCSLREILFLISLVQRIISFFQTQDGNCSSYLSIGYCQQSYYVGHTFLRRMVGLKGRDLKRLQAWDVLGEWTIQCTMNCRHSAIESVFGLLYSFPKQFISRFDTSNGSYSLTINNKISHQPQDIPSTIRYPIDQIITHSQFFLSPAVSFSDTFPEDIMLDLRRMEAFETYSSSVLPIGYSTTDLQKLVLAFAFSSGAITLLTGNASGSTGSSFQQGFLDARTGTRGIFAPSNSLGVISRADFEAQDMLLRTDFPSSELPFFCAGENSSGTTSFSCILSKCSRDGLSPSPSSI